MIWLNTVRIKGRKSCFSAADRSSAKEKKLKIEPASDDFVAMVWVDDVQLPSVASDIDYTVAWCPDRT